MTNVPTLRATVGIPTQDLTQEGVEGSGFVITVSTLLDLAPSFWKCYALYHGGTLSTLRVTRNGRSGRPSVSLMNSYISYL